MIKLYTSHFPKQEAAGGPFCLFAKVNHRNHTDKITDEQSEIPVKRLYR